MKIIKINTLNPYRDGGKDFDGSTISISLPSNIVSFEKSFGDSTFVGHTFKMADGTYRAIYANLLFESQLVFNPELKDFYEKTPKDVPGFTDQLKKYFNLLIGDKEVPQALYHASKEKTLNSLTSFLNNDDSTFEYYLSQPFQDTASVKSLTRYWQNNVNSELSSTFEKGNQLPYFSKLENEIAIYRLAEQGSYTKVDNKFSGNYNTVFYCGGVLNQSFVTETEAIERATQEAGKCQEQQCVRLKSMTYNPALAEAQVELKNTESEQAQEALSIAKANFTAAKEENDKAKDKVADAKSQYDECAAQVPPCPELAELLQKLKNAEADLASATAAVIDAENALAAATNNADEAERAEAQAQQNKRLADDNCDQE